MGTVDQVAITLCKTRGGADVDRELNAFSFDVDNVSKANILGNLDRAAGDNVALCRQLGILRPFELSR